MNRYQEALHFLSINEECNSTKCNECSIKTVCHKYSAINTLQELVDKETPKKPIKKNISNDDEDYDYCPCCEEVSGSYQKYCDKCGQKLDWSDE